MGLLQLSPTIVCLVSCVLLLQLAGATTDEEEHEHLRVARAIGGQGFRRGTFPWMVLLEGTVVTRRLFGIPISHTHMYCGAVLITSRWLVTAAHCFNDPGEAVPGVWKARMATSRIRPTFGQRVVDILGRVLNDDDFRQWEIDVLSIIMHPFFVQTDADIRNDIALVKLRSHVPNMRAVGPIALPEHNRFGRGSPFPLPGAHCITTGWGCTTPGGRPSTWAQQVSMPVLPSPRCERIYEISPLTGRICAGHMRRGIGICSGDSGGPLMCRHNNSVPASSINNSGSSYMLAGIVSFTSRHNPQSFPAVFTKVQDYVQWMDGIIEYY